MLILLADSISIDLYFNARFLLNLGRGPVIITLPTILFRSKIGAAIAAVVAVRSPIEIA